MRRIVVLGLCVLAGCAAKEAPLPPVPPLPQELFQQQYQWGKQAELVEMETDEVPVPVAPPPQPPQSNELVYDYVPNREYVVPVQLGWPVDIQFQPGEWLGEYAAGDRAYLHEDEKRWQLIRSTAGAAHGKDQQQDHLLITCTHPGQTMGVVALTDRHTYHLGLRCMGKTETRVVRWTYPAPPPKLPTPAKPRLLPGAVHDYQVGYGMEVAGDAQGILPVWVGNDARHMYVIFPASLPAEQAPQVRRIDASGPALVNSRMPAGLPILIVDGLHSRLEIGLGTGDVARVVTIVRSNLRQIHCPTDGECPVWPRHPRQVVQQPD